MADERMKEYWSREMDALLATYRQFQTLIPSSRNKGAAHPGEDGRYVEYLIREYLRRYLPRDLEVLTGFILRPAVSCKAGGKERREDEHECSGQLDILVYDSAHYPIYQRFGDSVIVPPEGVTGILSVKKHLRLADIEHELRMLGNASCLCPHILGNQEEARSPFTALVTMEDELGKDGDSSVKRAKKVYEKLKAVYLDKKPCFYDEMPDFIGSFSSWGLYKERPFQKMETHYFFYDYGTEQHSLGFQLILQNILSVYYHNASQLRVRPGFTDNQGESYTEKWGPIPYHQQRIKRKQMRKI